MGIEGRKHIDNSVNYYRNNITRSAELYIVVFYNKHVSLYMCTH